MNIGILKEEKVPAERRTPLLPEHCAVLLQKYPHLRISVQPYNDRCVALEEYLKVGCEVVEDLDKIDIFLGIKEVPIASLVENKTYLFFSHTAKGQAHNKPMLQAIKEKNIRLIDYELLVDDQKNRLVGFGKFAGIVGTYNVIRAYGLKYNLFELPPPQRCERMEVLMNELTTKAVPKLPPIKVVVTGTGRVGNGIVEVLQGIGFEQVNAEQFLKNDAVSVPTFTVLKAQDYYQLKGKTWDTAYFYAHPQEAISNFERFCNVADVIITGAYWNPASPPLFQLSAIAKPTFKPRLIGDISCDILGGIPCNLRASHLDAPFYDVSPVTFTEQPAFSNPNHITMLAVDNLPSALPYEASKDFGTQLLQHVIPLLLEDEKNNILQRAIIAQNGKLMPSFQHLL